MIYLAFYRGEGRFFSDTLVKRITRSDFSHCEMFTSAKPPSPGETHKCITAVGKANGVCIKDVTFTPGRYEFVPVPWAPEDTIQRALGRMGERYDYWGLLMTQFFNLRRHTEDKWFCSKLCGWALGLSETHNYAPGDLKRIVEEHNRVYKLAQITGRRTEAIAIDSRRLGGFPGASDALHDGPSFPGDYAGNDGTVFSGKGEWQPHVAQASQNTVRPRQAMRPSVAPAVVARGEAHGNGRAEPFELDTAVGATGGEVVDFRAARTGQAKLDR